MINPQKLLSLQSSTRYVYVNPISISLATSNFLLHSCSLHSNQSTVNYNDIQTVYNIICTSTNTNDMKKSLKSTQIFLSNDLIDSVLKKARFSHSNPRITLDFFNLTAQRRGFFHTSYSVDTMLYILGRNRRFREIWEVLGEIKKKDQSLITPRTVMVVLGRVAKICSVKFTVEMFKKFRRIVPVFGTECYNGLLRTLCQEKSMIDARNVYHSLKHEFKPDLQTFNILLSGWKSPEEAESFFGEMQGLGVKPDVVSYNCLIDVFCKGREVEKAFKVVDKMREEDIAPDVISYTSLIGGLGLVGQPDKARDLLKGMQEYGCYPDVAAYNAVIRNYCIAKRLGEAYKLLDEMEGKGLDPNATTYNVILRSLYWTFDLRSSWNLYDRMRRTGCMPNTQSCMFLIRLIKREEKVELALELWDDMVEKGFGSYTLVSDVLFDLLCDWGKLVEAERCFLQMVEKGQKPSNTSFRRIKVLMELTNKHDALQNLSAKMASFGTSVQVSLDKRPLKA